jgi:hypothetical protein
MVVLDVLERGGVVPGGDRDLSCLSDSECHAQVKEGPVATTPAAVASWLATADESPPQGSAQDLFHAGSLASHASSLFEKRLLVWRAFGHSLLTII